MTVETRWSAVDGERIDVENPATGLVLSSIICADEASIDCAVRAADIASKAWRRVPAVERCEALRRVADAIETCAGELAALETAENGKPLDQAAGDVSACIAAFRFFAGSADRIDPGDRSRGPVSIDVVLEPFGVVAAIIPFNWPPIHFAAKVAPALAVGNAVVLKPGEQAPLTILRLAEIASLLLPPDLLHVVPGGAAVGEALVSHPLVRKISFTGAPTTGRRVAATAAKRLTPTLLELGGKNPFVVFADADLDRVAADILEASFYNKGEACTAASRILVERALHDQLVARLVPLVEGLVTGDPTAQGTHIGPCVDVRQAMRVRDYIAIGCNEGAVIAASGALPTDPTFAAGHFVPPTLFVGVRSDMRIAQEEIFGPVAVVIPFDDEAEAVGIANGTEFGLVAAVYTADVDRGARVARAIEAGVVFVNNYWRGLIGTPFGGTKSSGYGREHATETLREFGYLKAVRTRTDAPLPRWPSA